MKFHGAVRNIIEHGLKKRHSKIAEALDELVAELPTWDKEDAEKEAAAKEKQVDKPAQEAGKRTASQLSESTDSTLKEKSNKVQRMS